MTAAVLFAAAILLAAASYPTWRLSQPHPGHHTAPRGRAAITWQPAVVPARPTRNRPPWPDLGARLVLAVPPPVYLPAGALAARVAAARWLVRAAEARATRPWAEETGAFSRAVLADRLAGAA